MEYKSGKYTFDELVGIIAKLRAPDGCPWDREQTHESIRKNLIEEAYELVEAIDGKNPEKIADESGDVLLQVMLHAQIGKDNGEYDITDVIDILCRKMIHRHPHVFGEVSVENSDEVLKNWDAIKRGDRDQKSTTEELRGVSTYIPTLMRAQKIYKKELDNKIAAAKNKVANFETELANAQKKAKEYQATIAKQNTLIAQLEEEERKAAEALAEANKNTASSEDGNKAAVSSSESSSNSGSGSASGSGTGAAIANYALKFVGNPYVFGGTSLTNGADCSGFTMSVHKHFGISIPRSSTAQSYGGKSVSISAVQPGDVIYYGNHVGIYIGSGQIVHASTAKTGIKVSNYMYRTPIRVSRYW